MATGQKKEAVTTLKQAEQEGLSVVWGRSKWQVLVAGGYGLAEAGEKEQAVAKLKEAAAAVMKIDKETIPNFFDKSQFYAKRLSTVREAMNKIGDQEGAAAILKKELELVAKIKNASTKSHVLRAMANSLFVAGDFQRAMEMIQLSQDAEERKKGMISIAELLAKTCLKRSFTPDEQALAKQLVEGIHGQ